MPSYQPSDTCPRVTLTCPCDIERRSPVHLPGRRLRLGFPKPESPLVLRVLGFFWSLGYPPSQRSTPRPCRIPARPQRERREADDSETPAPTRISSRLTPGFCGCVLLPTERYVPRVTLYVRAIPSEPLRPRLLNTLPTYVPFVAMHHHHRVYRPARQEPRQGHEDSETPAPTRISSRLTPALLRLPSYQPSDTCPRVTFTCPCDIERAPRVPAASTLPSRTCRTCTTTTESRVSIYSTNRSHSEHWVTRFPPRQLAVLVPLNHLATIRLSRRPAGLPRLHRFSPQLPIALVL